MSAGEMELRQRLTDSVLQRFLVEPPARGRAELWDTLVPGMHLRLTATGAATWSLRSRTRAGKHTRVRLGTYPTMGLAKARAAARDMLARIALGADPTGEKREARTERERRKGLLTVEGAIGKWLSIRESDRAKPLRSGTLALYRRTLTKDVVPELGKRLLRDTTREEWSAVITGKRRRAPAAAANLYRACSAFLNYAEAAGWIESPLLPRKGMSKLAPSVASRDRTLCDAELVEVWAAAAKLAPKPRAFIKLMILTGCRREEAADIATGELDLTAARWRIPAQRAKNHTSITVPLHPLALDALRGVWPNHDCGPDWRLLGKVRGSGLSGYSKIKATLDSAIVANRTELRAAGEMARPMSPWRLHDLRRTVRTGMARLGIPREIAELAVNHVSARSKLERTYDRHSYDDEIVSALGRWQAHVADCIAEHERDP